MVELLQPLQDPASATAYFKAGAQFSHTPPGQIPERLRAEAWSRQDPLPNGLSNVELLPEIQSVQPLQAPLTSEVMSSTQKDQSVDSGVVRLSTVHWQTGTMN